MNILFTRFPLESRFGGAEVQTLALMKGLRGRGHNIEFLGSCPVLLEETRKLRMENGEWRIGPPPVTEWNALSFLWRQFFMRKKLHSQFSILHSHFHTGVVCMLSLSEKLLLTPFLHAQGIKVMWIEHDRVGRWLTWNPWLPKLRKLSRFVTTIVVSDLSKKIYKGLGFKHIIAIPNGIDVTRLQSKNPQPTTHNPKTFRIGTLARLTRDKGIDVLIDAIKDLSDISLTIVGTGPENGNLQSAICNLQSAVIHPSTEDLATFYRSLDLFVLPSRKHDPFGLVAGEAMMMGIPTLVTDACGIAGYLQNGRDAVIVPAGSSRELHGAIAALQVDLRRREQLGKQGKSTAERLFSMDRMVEGYEQILKEK